MPQPFGKQLKGFYPHMEVSNPRGYPPKSAIFMDLFILNDPFWGIPIDGNLHVVPNFTMYSPHIHSYRYYWYAPKHQSTNGEET